MRYTISLALASLLATTAAVAEVPRVVTDIPPVHSLVAQVMGDLGTPELLHDRGASEHSFQLRPSQAAGLQDADLVVWIGPELTPWLNTALKAAPDSVPRMALLTVDGTALRDYAGAGGHGLDQAEDGHDHGHGDAAEAGHDHDHDHDHDYAESEAHDHDHSGTDPHAWMDPGNAQVWLSAIAAELSRLDPGNAATYAANAATAAETIATLDAEVTGVLAPVGDAPLVMFHDAYGYLAAHYGLNIVGTVALGDAASPGAARLRDLQSAVADGGAVCLFPEAQHDPDLLTQMAEATGAVIGGSLDPVGSTLEPGPGLYAEWLRGMAAAIAGCTAPA